MVGVMAKPWNNWYHCLGSTYGTWLPGDPRGFRTFRHHEHVEGDYKHPPAAGMYAARWEQSKRKLKYPPVVLGREQRQLLCRTMVERFEIDQVEVVALAVLSNHFHLLARFPEICGEQRERYSKAILRDDRNPAPRHYLGLARKAGSLALARANLKGPGQVWADRPLCKPVENRQHQCNVADYIVSHADQQASVWFCSRGFL